MTETQVLYIDTDISLGTPGAEIDDAAALMMLLNECRRAHRRHRFCFRQCAG